MGKLVKENSEQIVAKLLLSNGQQSRDLSGHRYTEIVTTALADLTVGEIIALPSGIFGSVIATTATGDKVALIVWTPKLNGVKLGTEAWVAGDRLTWDVGNSYFRKAIATEKIVGVAVQDVATNDVEGVLFFDQKYAEVV